MHPPGACSFTLGVHGFLMFISAELGRDVLSYGYFLDVKGRVLVAAQLLYDYATKVRSIVFHILHTKNTQIRRVTIHADLPCIGTATSASVPSVFYVRLLIQVGDTTLKEAIRRATLSLKFVPVFMGSAYKNKVCTTILCMDIQEIDGCLHLEFNGSSELPSEEVEPILSLPILWAGERGKENGG